MKAWLNRCTDSLNQTMNLNSKTLYQGMFLFMILQLVIPVYYWAEIRNSLPVQKLSETLYMSKEASTVIHIATTPVNNSLPRDVHIRKDGIALAQSVNNVCKSISTPNISQGSTMHYTADGKVKMCPMEKIGSTYWRRVFSLATSKRSSKYKNPYDIPPGLAISQKRQFSHSHIHSQPEFSFLFVRDPFSRLLSTFVDKLVPPNPLFWDIFGKRAVEKFRSPKHRVKGQVYGHDVTFTEFVKFATDMEKSSPVKNGHIRSIKLGCQPCQQSYTFVGRMEQFKDDAFYVMKKMGLEDVVTSMNSTFVALAEDDVITDGVRDPILRWKKSIVKFMSWKKALQRLWLKMQLRGIISKDIDLQLSEARINSMTADEFIRLARKAHSESDPVKLKQQKELVKQEAFASVPLSVLQKFANTFRDDFVLFGYDQFPSKYFDRVEEPRLPSVLFNYTHLN